MVTKKDLIKISDYLWEIPKSFRADMRVPARIYADEKLLGKAFEDESLTQLVNTTTLPGVVKYALAMPDIHEGYGFCLSKDAKIISEFGYFLPIKDFEKQWPNQHIKIFSETDQNLQNAEIKKFFKIKPKNKILKITTKSGQTIIATEDHPFYTRNGMKRLALIEKGEYVAVHGFSGVPCENPSQQNIITKDDIRKMLLKTGIKQESPRFNIILKKIENRQLLPLTYNHPKFPYLIKIAAFIFGDGAMNFIGKRGDGILHFCGEKDDLEAVKQDLTTIGYTSSRIYSRKYKTLTGKITTNYEFYVNASSLVVFLEALGVPRGRKVNQNYQVPKWIFKAPLWQKRLFLASLFGCELRMPHRRLNRRGNFNAPVFVMNKSEELKNNGKKFLTDLVKLLSEFGVRSTKINQRRRHVAKNGIITWSFEIIISSKPENLINLWGNIGYEYNKKRSFLASVAICYLRLKQSLLQEKKEAIEIRIPKLLEQGLNYNQIALQLTGNPLSIRFITDVCWKIKNGWQKIIPRVPPSFPLFQDYLKISTVGLGRSGLVWDKVVEIKEIKLKNNYVYDLTVAHPNHNFIANGFLVSNCIGGVAATELPEGVISPGGVGFDINCGVRILKSDLNENDVRPHLVDLMNQLQRDVPSGVGRGGGVKLNPESMKNVLEKGVRNLVENNYGVKEDIEHCEEYGLMQGADAVAVSEQAKNRGKDQLGTLGSGNHFLEVQRVEEIFDEEAVKEFGLFKNQITIMIHSGSRGLGHQVCTDYVRIFHGALSKYNIKLPDPELACAPFNSSEGQRYFGAMAAAANYAWANRQMMTHLVRQAWKKIIGEKGGELNLIYDVAHNIAKKEKHEINGKQVELCVHRKGATRAFPKSRPEIPEAYKKVGQPVLIPGTMGTASYILVGTEEAKESFYSVCHGAGRMMSRHAALRLGSGQALRKELEEQGIIVRCLSSKGLAEEAPIAYKDINNVVSVVVKAGLAKNVAKLKPLGVVKG